MEPKPKTSSSQHEGLISQSNTTLWTNSQIYDSHNHQQPVITTTSTMFRGQSWTYGFNLNQEDDEEIDEQVTNERTNLSKEQENCYQQQQQQQQHVPKEPMFEKTLTPSDVGKLNRLVIPKQQAEKYFPLGCGGDSGEKGMLLSFEDQSGKLWGFRYSYWNSSQSYVLTKGWSRFVKEKQLDAGDIVLFERHRMDGERLFIGWRRRTATAGVAQPAEVAANGGGTGWTRAFYSEQPYPSQPNGPPLPYQPPYLHAGSIVQNQTVSSGNSKTLRLFGVNLEYQPEPEPEPDIGSSVSSSHGEAHYHHHYYPYAHASDHHNDMDINFPRDVNQMRYHQG